MAPFRRSLQSAADCESKERSWSAGEDSRASCSLRSTGGTAGGSCERRPCSLVLPPSPELPSLPLLFSASLKPFLPRRFARFVFFACAAPSPSWEGRKGPGQESCFLVVDSIPEWPIDSTRGSSCCKNHICREILAKEAAFPAHSKLKIEGSLKESQDSGALAVLVGEMIQLLFLVLFAEGAVALLLMVKIGPLRELAMRGIDQAKEGKGPATVKTLACTLMVIFMSSVASLFKIQNRGLKLGTVSPMDQVLWRTHLLESSLIGYILFLAFVIDRLHHYHRKLIILKKTAITSREEAEKLQMELQGKDDKSSKEITKLRGELSSISGKMRKLKSESEEHERRRLEAETHVSALQKQSEELLLEYDRLLEDNQILQTQVLSLRS